MVKYIILAAVLGGLGYGGYYIYKKNTTDVDFDDLIKDLGYYAESAKNKDYSGPPYVRGKVVFLDTTTKTGMIPYSVDDMQKRLPDEIRARNRSEVGTVVFVYKTGAGEGDKVLKEWEEQRGFVTIKYSLVRRSANPNPTSCQMTIIIIDKQTQNVVGAQVFDSLTYGDWPEKECFEYLKKLPRK